MGFAEIRRRFEALAFGGGDDADDQPIMVAELALWAATSDGVIARDEVRTIVLTLQEVPGLEDLRDEDAEALLDELEGYDGDDAVEARIRELAAGVTDPDLRRVAYQLAVWCAAHDGVFSDDERDFLDFLAHAFALGPDDAARLAREATAP